METSATGEDQVAGANTLEITRRIPAMTLPPQPACLFCEQDSHTVPLLVFEYRGEQYWICPQDLPILIHKPEQAGDKLPGYRVNIEADSDHH